uniref:Uncharacterized protein n=1 Tax=Micrurus lemniscatus lemniscatus TaxID=129467 RepID=A0A2D4J7H6_MICLE
MRSLLNYLCGHHLTITTRTVRTAVAMWHSHITPQTILLSSCNSVLMLLNKDYLSVLYTYCRAVNITILKVSLILSFGLILQLKRQNLCNAAKTAQDSSPENI